MPEEEVKSRPEPTSQQNAADAIEAPRIAFSFWRWASMGIVRVLYRIWTRIAVRLFPENSRSERIARKLHLPLPDTLNMSWITPHLAVGGRIRDEDIPTLRKIGVTHVIDTRIEYSDDREALAREQIELLYIPAPDTYPLSVDQLMEGASWANERIEQGARVLIHCEHGVGRSVLLACATLAYSGMPTSEALELVKEKRWQAAPNKRQVERLQDFDAAYRAQTAH